MLDRTVVRCPVCRSAVPLAVVWMADDACPRCSRPLAAARQRPRPGGVLGQTLAVRSAREAAPPRPGRRAHP